MTVQELIDSLNKIKDKSSVVYFYDGSYGEYFSIDDIEDNKDGEIMLFGETMLFNYEKV